MQLSTSYKLIRSTRAFSSFCPHRKVAVITWTCFPLLINYMSSYFTCSDNDCVVPNKLCRFEIKRALFSLFNEICEKNWIKSQAQWSFTLGLRVTLSHVLYYLQRLSLSDADSQCYTDKQSSARYCHVVISQGFFQPFSKLCDLFLKSLSLELYFKFKFLFFSLLNFFFHLFFVLWSFVTCFFSFKLVSNLFYRLFNSFFSTLMFHYCYFLKPLLNSIYLWLFWLVLSFVTNFFFSNVFNLFYRLV